MDNLEDVLKEIGFFNIGAIEPIKLPFEPTLIELCVMNSCGNYGKCYTCPPHIGKTEELIEKAKSYNSAYVFQKIYKLEDSFDFEGMTDANVDFQVLTRKLTNYANEHLKDFLILGAGGCRLCKTCGVVTNEPCRDPMHAISSLEAYSIQVSTLAELTNMKYINGVNTVTYFGAILLNI